MKRKMGIRITDADKRHVKQLDLNRFMEEYLGMKCKARSGGNSYYLSPFRTEKEPSFTVNYYRGEWCWKDWGGDPDNDRGDILTLVMRIYNVEFVEAARMLFAKEFSSEYYQREAECEKLDREKKLSLLRKIYLRSLKVNNISLVNAYFQELGVQYHYPMGCAFINSFREKKRYVAIPLPSPWDIRGLEMREMKGTSRKTFGEKTFWTLNRNPRKVLLTESVLDSLAGEIILNDNQISLWSLNGVANVNQLPEFLGKYGPEEVYLALDNDAPGMAARDKAVEILSQTRSSIVLVEDHIKAGVKDLHKFHVRQNLAMAQKDES